jgi:membrane protein
MPGQHTLPPPWLFDSTDPIYRLATHHAWDAARSDGRPTSKLTRPLRIADLAIRGLMNNDATHYAAAMTYTTVLSIVPLLAFVFSVAKGFGGYDALVDETITPFLDENFGRSIAGQDTPPLRQAIDQILAFVDRTNSANLGVVGLLTFLYTAIGLLKSLEHSFNRIFRVANGRSFGRKIVDYTALLVLSPVLLVLATGAVGAVQSNAVVDLLNANYLGPVVTVVMKVIGFAMLAIAFGAIYLFLPHTKVHWLGALLGGLVGGSLWQLLLVLLVKLQVGIAGYNQLYAGFAALPIFLFWLYLSWIAVMLGAHVAWAYQSEDDFARSLRRGTIGTEDREQRALYLITEIGNRFAAGSKPPEVEGLARKLALSIATVEDLVCILEKAGILARAEKGGGVLPAKDLSKVQLGEVVIALRGGEPVGEDAVARALRALRGEEAKVPASATVVGKLLG